MFTYRNTQESARLLSYLANGEGRACSASDRRIDVPEKVGGPALYVNAEGQRMDQDGRGIWRRSPRWATGYPTKT